MTAIKKKLEAKLFAYAMAAGAAGVAALALVEPSPAEVVYTPAERHLFDGPGGYRLDVNNDGVVDFFFYIEVCGDCRYSTFGYVVGGSQAANRVVAGPALYQAAKLGPDVEIGPDDVFVRDASMGSGAFGPVSCEGGPWADGGRGFLGLRFAIGGETHYGWAAIACEGSPKLFHLTGYAYETVPGQPIKTGAGQGEASDAENQTPSSDGTLGALAKGALLRNTPSPVR